MSEQEKAAMKLHSIQNELSSLFGDFCRRSDEAGIASLMQEFSNNKISLVFSISASVSETSLFCGFINLSGEPKDIQTLFTIQTPVLNNASGRGIH